MCYLTQRQSEVVELSGLPAVRYLSTYSVVSGAAGKNAYWQCGAALFEDLLATVPGRQSLVSRD